MNTPKLQIELIKQPAKAESTLDIFLTLSLDLFCIRQQTGYFHQLNPAWETVLGWTDSELRSHSWIELVHPEDRELSETAESKCSKKNLIEYENRYRHKDGSYRWLSWRVSQDEEGLFYGVAKDITTIKQAEEAQRDRLEFETLITTLSTEFINLGWDEIDGEINHALQVIGEFANFDHSYVVLFSGDYSEGNIAYAWSAEIDESARSPWERFSTKPFWWGMEKLMRFEAIQVPTLADLPPEAGNTKLALHSSGTKSSIFVPIVQAKSLIGFVGFASTKEEKTCSDSIVALLRIVGDIFANALNRKQVSSKLWESERRFRAVFNQTFQLTSLLALDGKVLEDNQTAMDLCQLERSEVVGHPFWELKCWTISPETQEQLKNAIASAAAGNVVRYEADILAPDDTVVTIDFSLKPLKDETGQVELLIAEGRDLTERKRVESALRESEERWQLALQGSNAGIWDLNLKTNEVFYSARWKEILGYQEHEIVNSLDEWMTRVHPNDLERMLQIRQEHLEGKTPYYTAEYRMRCKDGSYKWMVSRAQVLWDEAGNPVRMVGSHADISDRKQAETALQQLLSELETKVEERTADLKQANEQLKAEIAERQQTEVALRQSEEQFRRVFDEAPIGMVMEGLDERLIRVNRSLCEMLGYTESELMSLNCVAITHPEDLELELPYVEQLITREIQGFQLEKRFLKKNQDLLWVNITVLALRDQTGAILYFLGMVEDISERKQALEALQQSEAHYRAIVEDQTELICRYKPDKTLTFVNDAYCRYFSQRRSEVIGHSFMPLILEADQELVSQHINFLSQTQPIITYEHRVILPSGEIRWHQWTDRAVIFDEQGNVIECQAVGRDITELKQAEAEVRKALEKERELSEFRSSFISLVSHEFRTPLTTIQSSDQMLERYGNRLSDEKQQNHHRRIQTAVKRMTQLLEDVLTIGKADAGKLKFEPSPIDLVAFCRDIVESMQTSVPQKHAIAFMTHGECSNAQMDENLLEHIVTNLLSNALKYSPQGGTIQFELTCTSSSAVFRIQDSGIGIPQKDLDQLFESFGRASNVGHIPGTGLGLAIVKRCVDLHGGQIAVESEVGIGTTFTVTLPLHLAA